jgi:predicted RNA-binding Zn ribbon-like protein
MDAHGRTTIVVRPLESLAVEFVSSWHYDGNVVIDELSTVAGLASWIMTYQDRLGLAPGGGIEIASADLARVTRTRAAIRELLDAAVAASQPDPAAVELVSDGSRGAQAAELRWLPSGPRLEWPPDASTAGLLITQVCASTVRLLTSPRARYLRRCPASRCVLFFTALRPGQTWCSQACGNRARVARHGTATRTRAQVSG